MLVAVILAVLLVVVTFVVHFIVLRWLSAGMGRVVISGNVRILIIVIVVLAAHLVEIGIYAAAYEFGEKMLNLGSFGGIVVKEYLDYLYFSIVSYTSLGLGDVFPQDHLRFITGVEALNGLLLIAWSGSFIYIAMGRFWTWPECQ